MSDAVLLALITSVPTTIIGILSAVQVGSRRTRKRLQRQARELDSARAYIYASHDSRHVHNRQHHAGCPESQIEIPPLPSFMQSEEDE